MPESLFKVNLFGGSPKVRKVRKMEVKRKTAHRSSV